MGEYALSLALQVVGTLIVIAIIIPIMSVPALHPTVPPSLTILLSFTLTLTEFGYVVPCRRLAVFLPLVTIYLWMTRYYRMSNRDLARIESISRTPISAHFAETLQGAVSIRALHAESMYIKENQRKTDDNTRALYFSQTISVWLRIRLDILGSLILGSCAAFAVASVGSTISPGNFGLLRLLCPGSEPMD